MTAPAAADKGPVQETVLFKIKSLSSLARLRLLNVLSVRLRRPFLDAL